MEMGQRRRTNNCDLSVTNGACSLLHYALVAPVISTAASMIRCTPLRDVAKLKFSRTELDTLIATATGYTQHTQGGRHMFPLSRNALRSSDRWP